MFLLKLCARSVMHNKFTHNVLVITRGIHIECARANGHIVVRGARRLDAPASGWSVVCPTSYKGHAVGVSADENVERRFRMARHDARE